MLDIELFIHCCSLVEKKAKINFIWTIVSIDNNRKIPWTSHYTHYLTFLRINSQRYLTTVWFQISFVIFWSSWIQISTENGTFPAACYNFNVISDLWDFKVLWDEFMRTKMKTFYLLSVLFLIANSSWRPVALTLWAIKHKIWSKYFLNVSSSLVNIRVYSSFNMVQYHNIQSINDIS